MVNYDGEFVAATVEGLYGPVWNVLTGRIDLYQVRSHYFDAPTEFVLFPMLGLDVMVEPPVDWRVKPYFWVGARATAYTVWFAPPPNEPLAGLETHWRGGLGAKFNLTKRTELFAEAQLYSNDLMRDNVGILHEGSFTNRLTGIEVSGLVGAEIGARFALGK
jgi:hypothetical protein